MGGFGFSAEERERERRRKEIEQLKKDLSAERERREEAERDAEKAARDRDVMNEKHIRAEQARAENLDTVNQERARALDAELERDDLKEQCAYFDRVVAGNVKQAYADLREEAAVYRVEVKRLDTLAAQYIEKEAVLRTQLAAERKLREETERERDAYKKAKAENDDRFMRERDEARHHLEILQQKYDLAVETLAMEPNNGS